MKQVIPFKKEILFKTKICEITSISLEHTLSLVEDDLINGEFTVSGDYKMTEASINREKFIYNIPCEISLNKKYSKDNLIIDIDNFYYEVINNEYLKVFIDVYIDGEELSDIEEIEPDIIRNDSKLVENNPSVKEESLNNKASNIVEENNREFKEEEKIVIDEKEEIDDKEENDINSKKEDTDSFNIFSDNINGSDIYVTYHVYIVKENDNIDSIINKFNTTKDIISEYNDINDIKTGSKIIIPSNQNE